MANGIIAVVKLTPSPTSVIKSPGSAPTISLKNVPLDQEFLNKLLDVDSSSLQDGYVLVYNEATGKYVTQPPPTSGGVDGGSF